MSDKWYIGTYLCITLHFDNQAEKHLFDYRLNMDLGLWLFGMEMQGETTRLLRANSLSTFKLFQGLS